MRQDYNSEIIEINPNKPVTITKEWAVIQPMSDIMVWFGDSNVNIPTQGMLVSGGESFQLEHPSVGPIHIYSPVETSVHVLYGDATNNYPYRLSYFAKSIILDIADNHGDPLAMGVRAIELYLRGTKITQQYLSDFSAYSTSGPAELYNARNVFDELLSLTGPSINNGWRFDGGNTNQRLTWVFNTPILFDSMVVHNGHEGGIDTDEGANNVKISISSDAITDVTYGGIVPNSTLIYDGVFREHVGQDVEDPETLVLI